MGKEAKIGLAVLSVLLITFGVVLTRRLMGPSEIPPAEPSGPPAIAADDSADETPSDEMQNPAGTGIPSAARSARPEALPPTSERAA